MENDVWKMKNFKTNTFHVSFSQTVGVFGLKRNSKRFSFETSFYMKMCCY